MEISGKRVEKTPVITKKGDSIDKTKNEFTFSARESFDYQKELAKSNPKITKNPFERNLVSDDENNKVISKNEIFERLGIKNPEAEKVADLSATSMLAGSGLAKSKKEVTNELINNLESQIAKLKYKRDTVIAVNNSILLLTG